MNEVILTERKMRDMAKRLAKELQRHDIILSQAKCSDVVARILALPNVAKHQDPETIPYHHSQMTNQVTLTSHEYGYAVKGNGRKH